MQIPAHICKRISKKGEAPICRGKCSRCPCVGIVRGVYNALGGDPREDLEMAELPEQVSTLLKTSGERVWRIFLAGGEVVEETCIDDGCGHTLIDFDRTLPEGFLNTDDASL